MEGDPRFDASQNIPYVPYYRFAEMIGLEGIRLAHSSEIEDAVRRAFAADRPAVIDASTDPEEPPLPPHISFDEAIGFTKSFVKAPSAGAPGVVEALKEKVEEIRPGGGR